MSVAPANTSSVLVAVSGVLQTPSTYSVSGTTLTFSAAPPTGTGNISARYLGIPASGVTTTAYRTVTEFTATAGQTTFTPPSYTVGFIQVFRNGVLLGSADYTATNGTTVVLALGATAGDLVTVESFYVSSVLNAIPNTVGAVTPSLLSGNAPQITVYTSGSGTYTVPTNAKAIQVEMAGGGGGGGSSGSGTGNGSAGGTTTFGTSLLTCTGGGGGGGNTYGSPGGGGTATLSSPATGLALTGGSGMAIGFNISGTYVGGGAGGTAPFGGAGCAGPANASGGVGNANTGAGGGGGGSPVSQNGGCGGGSGAYIKAIITSPSATYSYAVGAGGAGGTAGGSNAGGAGAAGVIIVTAYF
jgi:hypothetical protein